MTRTYYVHEGSVLQRILFRPLLKIRNKSRIRDSRYEWRTYTSATGNGPLNVVYGLDLAGVLSRFKIEVRVQ